MKSLPVVLFSRFSCKIFFHQNDNTQKYCFQHSCSASRRSPTKKTIREMSMISKCAKISVHENIGFYSSTQSLSAGGLTDKQSLYCPLICWFRSVTVTIIVCLGKLLKTGSGIRQQRKNVCLSIEVQKR